MTVEEEMKERALAEFDRLVEEKETETRLLLAAQGRSREEIDIYIAACLDNLAKQRADIGQLVSTEIKRAGVPLDYPAKATAHDFH
ncbi:hypothetical protein [Sphingopyxis witflariensis]|uniref:Uncharacterized protein n=1 Tax=Sphingopyxis witflariensis TaxID=173675 RepID=A0A2D0AMY3_9SPHN|nr:hypothetical protein [Sphingopyxis witflariensis]OWQ95112.1 hypothetical protein CDQ91_14420 [Sphingopyxis witflariensis]